MKNVKFLITCYTLVLLSCTGDKDKDSVPAPTGPPVETKAANTGYSPAFVGQTRVGSITTTSKYKTDVISTDLTSPWGIAALPDGRLLVTEKAGQMRIVTASGSISEPITGIPPVNSSGQGGLLGLCLDPEFTSNRMLYWSFSESRAEGNVTAIGKGRLSDNERAIEDATVIYRALPAYNGTAHYGGRVIFDRTGNLVLSTGDRSDLATRPQAQDPNSALGKIIRITKDGQAAPGNPFVSQSGAKPELYSIGQRNPQGLARHPETGDIWENEHGPKGGDELNLVKPGANYGWPVITYGIEYGGQQIGSGITQKEGMEQPLYYWDPIIAPSGMTFYSGNRISEWRNNLFIACLAGSHIARLVIVKNRVVAEERLLPNEKQRFRDITQGTDGALYAITDQGRLYKIDKE